MTELVFLKLGGSLITDKAKRYTPRFDKLSSLAREIRGVLQTHPDLSLLLGHGSGSFGHYAVQEHLDHDRFPPTSNGRSRDEVPYWAGLAEVWYRASELNRHVMNALHAEGIPAVAFAPSSAITTSAGKIVSWDLAPLRAALDGAVLPVIFGDIVFDDRLGGKVLSTEELMWHLATSLHPRRVLLAGLEEAVWADFPERARPITKITPSTFGEFADRIGGSHGPDVTGGMRSKVGEMLSLVQAVPGLTVRIFSGEGDGNVRRALAGEGRGTLIASD